jgi:hypothetical protein
VSPTSGSGESRGEPERAPVITVNLPPKQDQFLCVAVWNMNGLPVDPADPDGKMKKLHDFVENQDIDIWGNPEMNVNWRNMEARARLEERTRTWFSAKKIFYGHYYGFQFEESFQPGGVIQWARNSMAHRVSQKGRDSSGLGRWVWQRFQGKAEVAI